MGDGLLKKICLVIMIAIALTASLYFIQQEYGIFTRDEWSQTSGDDNSRDIKVLIDINEKLLYVISGEDIMKKYSIASGRPDTPSPLGDFVITQKSRWGEGFGSAWLGLDVPWGTYGIHGTTNPGSIGHSASHGCIRMRNRDIDSLYRLVRVGTPVKIIGGMYGMLGNGFRKLAPGDRGADVYIVQKRLKQMGYYKGRLDGIYGKSLEKALNNFQKETHIPITNRIGTELYKKMGIVLFE
jgi:hypothetical protein